MLSDQEIEIGKQSYYTRETKTHEHNDCIRIAYEWLDAQKKIATPNKKHSSPLKHIIESWAKRYVSQSDVELAASLHSEISGQYPDFNISAQLTLPNARRLIAIGEAGKHQTYTRYEDGKTYKVIEN